MSANAITLAACEVFGLAISAKVAYPNRLRNQPSNMPCVVVEWADVESKMEANTTRNGATGKLRANGVKRIHTGRIFFLLSTSGDVEAESVNIAEMVDRILDAAEADVGLRAGNEFDACKWFALGKLTMWRGNFGDVVYAGLVAPWTACEA